MHIFSQRIFLYARAAIFIALIPGVVLWILFLGRHNNTETYTDFQKPELYVFPEKNTLPVIQMPPQKIQALAQKIGNGFFNPGFTQYGWWVYLPLSAKADPQWLQVANPQINELKIFLFENDAWRQVYRSGDNYPFAQRTVAEPDYWYRIPGGTGALLIYADKKGESLHIPVRLVSANDLAHYLSDEKTIRGIFIGWFLLLFLMNFFLWLSLNDDIHLLYNLYITASALWILAQWGLGFQYLWPDAPDFASKARPLFSNFSFLFILEFTKRYFTNPGGKPRFNRQVRLIEIVLLISTAGLLLTPNRNVTGATRLVFLSVMNAVWLASILVLLAFIWVSRGRTAPARFYIAAFATILLFTLVILFSQYSVNADWLYDINKYGSAAGFLAESTILSFGLTQRYNFYKKEKEKIQQALELEKKTAADRVIQTQEEERQRLARELHDGLGGLLGSIRISTDHQLRGYPEQRNWLGEQLDMAIRDLRNIAHDLMPVNLQEQGLERTLFKTVERWNMDERLQIRLNTAMQNRYPVAVEAGIYHIISELLHNVKKHAGASEVNIELWEEARRRGLTLLFEDNGVGFSTAGKEGLGWKNIRHRVQYMEGKITVDSNSAGTTIIIEIPLADEK